MLNDSNMISARYSRFSGVFNGGSVCINRHINSVVSSYSVHDFYETVYWSRAELRCAIQNQLKWGTTALQLEAAQHHTSQSGLNYAVHNARAPTANNSANSTDPHTKFLQN